MLPGQVELGLGGIAGRRVGIGAAANRDERDCSGVIAFERFLRETSPIAADFVELPSEGCAMAGIIRDQRANLSRMIGGEQDRERMIDRPGRVFTELDSGSLH